MANSEIRIAFDDSSTELQAEILEGLKPIYLFEGLFAYVDFAAEILEVDKRSIMSFATMLLAKWENNPEAAQKESVEIKIPKGLNLSGKEEQ